MYPLSISTQSAGRLAKWMVKITGSIVIVSAYRFYTYYSTVHLQQDYEIISEERTYLYLWSWNPNTPAATLTGYYGMAAHMLSGLGPVLSSNSSQSMQAPYKPTSTNPNPKPSTSHLPSTTPVSATNDVKSLSANMQQ